MTPAEELRAAATLVRETAAKATPGPWEDCSTDDEGALPRWIIGQPVVPGDEWSIEEPLKVTDDLIDHEIVSREDVAWIALMSPAVAEPIAAWLDEEARQFEMPPCDSPDGCCNRCDSNPSINDALAVARALLGSAR